MKKLFLSIAASIALLTALNAPAELVIYKGTGKVNYTGMNLSLNVDFKMFLVIDHDAGFAAELLYANINGLKYYSSAHETNLHFVEINGPQDKTVTVMSRVRSQCDIDEGSSGEDVFVQGKTTTIIVNSNTTLSFPKTLKTEDHAVDYSDGSNQPNLVNGNFVLNLDKKRTMTSNAAGETIDEALDGIANYVQSLGYTEAPALQSDSRVKINSLGKTMNQLLTRLLDLFRSLNKFTPPEQPNQHQPPPGSGGGVVFIELTAPGPSPIH